MDRYWLLTWTTYGSWLPGDSRGFVSPVDVGEATERRHNVPGTPYDADVPGLERSSRRNLKGPEVRLGASHATILLSQFHETATYRTWRLLAVAMMKSHVHLVIGVPGDPDPSDILGDFKSYGSRALNRTFGKPTSGTWWTESGSKRKLPDEAAVFAAMRYVKHQVCPLLVWIADGIEV